MSEIAPGAERRRVHVGDCAGRGAPARSCRRLRRARSAGAFPLGDGFRIRNPPALARRLAFSLLPAFKQARRGHSQKNPQQMLRVS